MVMVMVMVRVRFRVRVRARVRARVSVMVRVRTWSSVSVHDTHTVHCMAVTPAEPCKGLGFRVRVRVGVRV